MNKELLIQVTWLDIRVAASDLASLNNQTPTFDEALDKAVQQVKRLAWWDHLHKKAK